MLSLHEVLIFTTGGTIEKIYNEFDGSLENKETTIRNKISSRLRLPATEIHVTPLMSKDSLHMTDEDRDLILNHVKEHAFADKSIIVLHGTDTMAVTAERCWKSILNPKVPIIFTGAMRPMGFEDSDALQNITEALILSKVLKPGFYICFHNQIFEVPGVQKNRIKGTFERV
ncbi:MAG: asparaginase [Bdellovibrionales bacterium]|nr:asparaginase [Bdellovibrionales bacterium]